MDYFAKHGVHALVDGQFGSTGKGLLASYLARQAHQRGIDFEGAISNAGPNSGHTFYHEGVKHVLKQLPTFAVKMSLLGHVVPAYLSAGAIIDPEIMIKEAGNYSSVPIYIHRHAAVVTNLQKDAEKIGTIAAVAGTRSGTGAALIGKIGRDPLAVIGAFRSSYPWPSNVHFYDGDMFNPDGRYFMEVSQGFSLGLHSSFYPKVTSRECTVMQGLADARIPPRAVTRTFMVARTYPIRVGNVDGYSSGDWYPDQTETNWQELGVTPELTTVTQRVRRVATFSIAQMVESILANAPDFILWNFMNYLTEKTEDRFHTQLQRIRDIVPYEYENLYGYGAEDNDVRPF